MPGRLSPPLRLALAALLCLLPCRAQAHEILGVSGFPAMVLHPLVALDLLLCLVAIGLVAGQQASPGVIGALALAAAGIIIGHLAQTQLLQVRGLWRLPFAAAALAGLVVAAGIRLGPLLAAALILMLSAVVGLGISAHTPGIMGKVEALGGAAVAASVPIVLLGLSIARLDRWLVRIGVRVLGAWLAAIAILGVTLPGS